MASIETVKIHPAIGVARLGNSPTEFFVGPEKPGVCRRPAGGYKDAQGRVKRQAARFRLFGYDKDGELVREVTAKDADITWTVRLANQKPAWKQFDGLNPNAPLRNPSVADRNSLIIDPGPRSLTGPNRAVPFDTGTFLGVAVPLGEVRTDRHGRLLVLGGFGQSASPTSAPLTTFANNDGWYDDVSDGPVTAKTPLVWPDENSAAMIPASAADRLSQRPQGWRGRLLRPVPSVQEFKCNPISLIGDSPTGIQHNQSPAQSRRRKRAFHPLLTRLRSLYITSIASSKDEPDQEDAPAW
jgi:hypothetical protein